MNRIQKFQMLCGFVNDIVQQETSGDPELAHKVLDRKKKDQEIVKVRERILRRVRAEIWEHHYGTPKWEVVRGLRPALSWKPLGYLQIASILGGDHSSWVKMAQTLQAGTVTQLVE